MAIRVGINGFGRIGRQVFRIMKERGGFDVVGINDITDAKTLGYLLKYDSIHGKYPGQIAVEGDELVVDGDRIKVTAIKQPKELPWKALGANLVLESTGVFRKKAQCLEHVEAGAKKVLLTVPAKDDVDATLVMGVNHTTYKPSDQVISNASCTTNCLAPMARVLNDTFGIVRGIMTTVHSYTNDQRILDLPHSDLRRARAAAMSIIPTSTGAAKAIGKVIPALDGKLDGLALRVPTPCGSLTDLTVELAKPATKDAINEAMKKAASSPIAKGGMQGILEYCDEPIVLADIVHNPASCVFDAPSTFVMGGSLVKVLGWYDNEWGYSQRCVDLLQLMAG
ncbi:MAG: type I glyceraldehyde-3-phosphate dehydrogenase [Verrucomicrobia bacterium]|nr:type I glyceraldehyde-3-phosphate dehydrogenase [Verrucomicrobiota bacterium]